LWPMVARLVMVGGGWWVGSGLVAELADESKSQSAAFGSLGSRSSPTTLRAMPFIHVAWLPKACRTPEIRKEVASAIIKAVTAVKGAQITPDKVVVRFSEAVDGFALPPGHTHLNVDLPVEKK